MSNYMFLEKYIPLVQFMAVICGPSYEIILHDVSTPERSVIAAHHANLSGRRVGDAMTELAKELIRDESYLKQDFVANYEGRTRSGKRFVSSTYFIKEQGELRGLICVNHDVEDFFAIAEHLNNLMSAFSVSSATQSPAAYWENLDDSICNISSNFIHTTVLNHTHADTRPTVSDNMDIIRILDNQGVFSTKGAVGQVAQEMGLSEPTVYRYLKKVRDE